VPRNTPATLAIDIPFGLAFAHGQQTPVSPQAADAEASVRRPHTTV